MAHSTDDFSIVRGDLPAVHEGWTDSGLPDDLRVATEYGENPKDRIGVTKPTLHLVPAAAMIRMAKVFELGAAKYGPYNWRDNAVKETVYLSAALRHIMSRLDGEDTDPESGQSHLAHVAACMSILIDAAATGNLVDDRPTKGVAAQLIRDLQVTNV